MSDKTFVVRKRHIEPVTTYREVIEVVLETDDWMEAHRAVIAARPRFDPRRDERVELQGTHPTHAFKDGRCSTCGIPNNSCYASHAPCGFDFEGHSLLTILERDANTPSTGSGLEPSGTQNAPAADAEPCSHAASASSPDSSEPHDG